MAQKFLVSTDTSGILGTPKDWAYLWGDILNAKNFAGFEAIGWSWTKNYFLDPKNRYQIAGIHGRTAGWREGRGIIGKPLLALLNLIFLTNNELINACPYLKYILLHRGCLDEKTKKLIIKRKNDIPLLFIENDICPNALTFTIAEVEEFRRHGVNAGMTVDVVHFLREPDGGPPNLARWELLIKMLKSLRHAEFPLNCHFPIGDYENDSLPISKITDEMWKELASVMNKIPFHFVVLENQARRQYSLFLTKSEQERLKDRTNTIYNTLTKYGIL